MALIPSAIYDFYVEAHTPRVGPAIRSRISSSPGCSWRLEQAVVFFAVFAYWFFRFLLEEERRADVDHPPAHA